jgi:hypothetical protein
MMKVICDLASDRLAAIPPSLKCADDSAKVAAIIDCS